MTAVGELHRCPPPEVLAAFVDARLPRERVVELTSHMASCAECRLVVESVQEFQAEDQQEKPEPQRGAAWRWLAVAAAVGASVLAVPGRDWWLENTRAAVTLGRSFWRMYQREPATPERALWRTYQRETARQDLVEAAAKLKFRPVEPRLTGFGWAAAPPTYRGPGNDEDTIDELIINAKAAAVIEATEHDASAEAAHLRGIAHLIGGYRGAQSVDELKTAAVSTNDAKMWSDLAAALLAAREYTNALEVANRAVQRDPDLDEGWFNRALATESLRGDAVAAWNEYLKHDDRSPWAKEARERIGRLRDGY